MEDDPFGTLGWPVIVIVIVRRLVAYHFAPVKAQHELNSEVLLPAKARWLFFAVLIHEIDRFGEMASSVFKKASDILRVENDE